MIKVLNILSSLLVMSYLTGKENFNLKLMSKGQAEFIKNKKSYIFQDLQYFARVQDESLKYF